MSNWKLRVSFKDFWGEYGKGNLTIQKVSGKVVERLNKLLDKVKDQLLKDTLGEIIMEFEDVAKSPELTVNDFDNVLNELYDWGDTEIEPFGKWPTNKMCWISTII